MKGKNGDRGTDEEEKAKIKKKKLKKQRGQKKKHCKEAMKEGKITTRGSPVHTRANSSIVQLYFITPPPPSTRTNTFV